jgi:hypothetical protein
MLNVARSESKSFLASDIVGEGLIITYDQEEILNQDNIKIEIPSLLEMGFLKG